MGANASTGEIFTIDPLSGQATDLTPTSVPWSSVGLEFEPQSGDLLAATGTELYRVDPVTGSSTLVGPLDGHVDDLALHPVCP